MFRKGNIRPCDAAPDWGYVSAALRAYFAAEGCVHTPPKRGMAELIEFEATPPAPQDREAILPPRGLGPHRAPARQDASKLDEQAHLAAAMINLRTAEFSHRA
jgi:hypothetical protein